jgi:hypothetical protein
MLSNFTITQSKNVGFKQLLVSKVEDNPIWRR